MIDNHIDWWVPVVDDNDPSPIREFINGYYYWGSRQYQVVEPGNPIFIVEKSREKPSTLQTLVKVALFVTLIIPLIAALSLLWHACTCHQKYRLKVETKPEITEPVKIPLQNGEKRFYDILTKALGNEKKNVMRMQDSIHHLISNFKNTLGGLPLEDKIEILCLLPSKVDEMKTRWEAQEGKHYSMRKDYTQLLDHAFNELEIVRDLFNHCANEQFYEKLESAHLLKMEPLFQFMNEEVTFKLRLGVAHFAKVNLKGADQQIFQQLKSAVEESYRLLKGFQKEDIEKLSPYQILKSKLEVVYLGDYFKEFTNLELTKFARDSFNPLALLLGLAELDIINATEDDSILTAQEQYSETQAQIDADEAFAISLQFG